MWEQLAKIKINLVLFIIGMTLASQIPSTYKIRRNNTRNSISTNLYQTKMRLNIFKKPKKNAKTRYKFRMVSKMILASKSKNKTKN